MPQIPVKQFATMCGVTVQAIGKNAKIAGPLEGAVSGKRRHRVVDTEHPRAKRYLKEHRAAAGQKMIAEMVSPSPPLATRTAHAATGSEQRGTLSIPVEDQQPEWPGEIAPYMDLTLRELLRRHGAQPALRAWLDAGQKITVIAEKEYKIEAGRGKLIDRDLVRTHVIGPIDGAMVRLLNDAPMAIVPLIREQIEAGSTDEAIIPMVQASLGGHVQDMKDRAKKGLRAATKKARKVGEALTDD